jgi:hypothetical protein
MRVCCALSRSEENVESVARPSAEAEAEAEREPKSKEPEARPDRMGHGKGSDLGALEGRKMFVAGLSYDSSESAFRKYFEQFGELEDCVVMKVCHNVLCVMFCRWIRRVKDGADRLLC